MTVDNEPERQDKHSMRCFSQLIACLEDGGTNDKLTRILQNTIDELVQHTLDHGGKPKGSISLSLSIAMDGGTIDIVPSINNKLPKAPNARTTYFLNQKNMLTLQNPKQQELPLKEVGQVTHKGIKTI